MILCCKIWCPHDVDGELSQEIDALYLMFYIQCLERACSSFIGKGLCQRQMGKSKALRGNQSLQVCVPETILEPIF